MIRLVQPTPVKVAQPLTIAELEEAIRLADWSALLVPARIVRRVIKAHAPVNALGLRVPHRKTYVIDRSDLLAIVDQAELDVSVDIQLPETVILIARPSAEALADLDRGEALLKYWRQLFHARVHAELGRAMAQGRLADNDVGNRIRQIGLTEFEEIRSVLRQEDFLLPPRTDQVAYVEFVAVYLELRNFAPTLLRTYFPSLDDLVYVDEVIKQDVDAQALMASTRLAGAPDPSWCTESVEDQQLHFADAVHGQPLVPRRLPTRQRSDRYAAALASKADRARRMGNLVRAAILRTRAAHYAMPEAAHMAREEARADLSRLARRLQAALNFSAGEADEWARSLTSLLEQSARGIWSPEARMLYDLQKVCVDHERGIYTLDVVGWIRSLGRASIKRFLPGQRDVLVSKHLRRAAQRLPSVRMSVRSRSRLAELVRSAVHRAEATLRARFRPPIERALDKVKLLPQNTPERVARKKLVDEMLDRIVERGFLTMGDLRDALSRNNLKLPDVTSVREFALGDQLLMADRHLAASLDGVYHAGEIYLRLPQRVSSLAFGTPLGRFLTRYAAIPFGGAFLMLEGLQFLITEVAHLFVPPQPDALHEPVVRLMTIPSVALLGTLLLGVLYYPRFRALCVDALGKTGRILRRVFLDLPAWVFNLQVVQLLVRSWQYRLLRRYVIRPLVLTVGVMLVVAAVSVGQVTFVSFVSTFIAVSVVLNSPIGRNVDELVTDWIAQTWHRLRIHLFATLFRLIMDVFNRLLETIDRLLYTVDEWLRFRAGERPAATAAKVVLGFIWFFVNYFVRFCVTLLIEPQLNPIKHFPVVTVSHKVLLPLTPAFQGVLAGTLGKYWAYTIATSAILAAPGIFGFLVWELKENWRLYAANRPPDLQPVPIGHHNETMLQLLKIGFRSGTIPKLYAKLRRASRKALYTDNWKACVKQLDALHHASEALRRFVDRELLALLHESRSWADRSITTGDISLGCNRILIELYCPDLGEQSMWLAFEEQAGWLVASIHRRGWSDSLSYSRRHTLASALAGFYKMAGVDLVREQIESRLDPASRGYEITPEALVVRSNNNLKRVYPLRDLQTANGSTDSLTVITTQDDRARWIFAATPIAWRRWVVTWELDQLDGSSKHQVLENIHLLPA